MPNHRPIPASPLDELLIDLGPRVAFPSTPAIAAAVRTRIVLSQPTTSRRSSWFYYAAPRRVAVAAIALVLVVAGLLIAFPDTRHSIARWLGIGPIEIVIVDESPTPAASPTSATASPVASPIGWTLALGVQVTLAEAGAIAGFSINLPARLGEPDEVYLRTSGDDAIVSLVYLPRDGLPMAAETGYGALIMYFPTEMQPGDVFKRIWDGQGTFEVVRIDTDEGFWISGETELVVDLDPDVTVDELIQRRSANVLIWEQSNVTYRLESALGDADSIAIAESIPLVPFDATTSATP